MHSRSFYVDKDEYVEEIEAMTGFGGKPML